MADFEKAYDRTAKFEGGYVHDPEDAGGETYKGISRRFHASWAGWGFIDAEKAKHRDMSTVEARVAFEKALAEGESLQWTVRQFYKVEYWDKVNGDGTRDQALASELYDTAVNMGIHRAILFLQKSLNCLNRNGELWPDLVEDGLAGPATHAAVHAWDALETYPDVLLKMLNVLQGHHYMEYMRKSPTQEKYARGWFSRVF